MKRRELPGGYWWSDSPDRSVLFRCYAWAATVTDKSVELDSRHGKLGGRCGSRAQGKRFVERWVMAQGNSTYRRWKSSWEPPKPYMGTAADHSYAAMRKLQQMPTATPAAAEAGPLEADWDSWVWRTDVPFEQVARTISNAR